MELKDIKDVMPDPYYRLGLVIVVAGIIIMLVRFIFNAATYKSPVPITEIKSADSIKLDDKDSISTIPKKEESKKSIKSSLPKEKVMDENLKKEKPTIGIQNNAPNYGNQHVGDINLNYSRVLDDKLKAEILEKVKGRKDQEISIQCVFGDSESLNLATQINDFLKAQGFIIKGGGPSQGGFSEPVKGLIWNEHDNELMVGSKLN